MRRYVTCFALSSLMSACANQTSIQGTYESERNSCQSTAESNILRYIDDPSLVSEEDRNAQLVTLFSDCMFEDGWTVATPAREGGKPNKVPKAEAVGASIMIKPGTSEDAPQSSVMQRVPSQYQQQIRQYQQGYQQQFQQYRQMPQTYYQQQVPNIQQQFQQGLNSQGFQSTLRRVPQINQYYQQTVNPYLQQAVPVK